SVLNIISRKCVSGEEPMDATSFNQSNQMPASAGAHDRRSGDNRDFAASAADAAQFLRDFANDGRLGFLGVNNVVDKLKRIRVRAPVLQRPAGEAAGSARPTLRLFRWTLRFEQSFDLPASDRFGLQ